MIRKIIFITISFLIILSPFIYLFTKGEYDGEQFFKVQSFESDKYSSLSTEDSEVVYKLFIEEDNWTGFDMPFAGNSVKESKVLVLDENKNEVRIGKAQQNLLINNEQITQVRFNPVSDSSKKYYYLVFEKGDSNWEMQYSLGDIYKPNELFINGKEFEGDLNLANVYKTDFSGMFDVLSSRLLYFFD